MYSESSKAPYAKNHIVPRLNLSSDLMLPETINHHVNRYRLAAQAVAIGNIAIDICSGTGYGTNILREAGAIQSIGVDLSAEAVDAASESYPDCTFYKDDAENFLENKSKEFGPIDIITMFEAIEHIPRENVHCIVSRAQSSLQPTGSLFVSTPRDIRADVNPDHITQWDFSELNQLLSGAFHKVVMLGQDWKTGEFTRHNPEQASFFVAHCQNPKT